jgi:hypothetical protein
MELLASSQPTLIVGLHHALLLQRLIQFLKQAQQMLGVLLLCSFGGHNTPGARDFFLFFQGILEAKHKGQYVGLTLDGLQRSR